MTLRKSTYKSLNSLGVYPLAVLCACAPVRCEVFANFVEALDIDSHDFYGQFVLAIQCLVSQVLRELVKFLIFNIQIAQIYDTMN